MNPFRTLARSKRFTPRGQVSLRKQRQLEEQLRNCQTQMTQCERRLNDHESAARSHIKAHVANSSVNPAWLEGAVTAAEVERRELAAYKEHAASLRSQIRDLKHPSPSQAAKRRAHQLALCKIAANRLELDHKLGRVIDDLRRLLTRRAALSEKMRAEAIAVELSNTNDALHDHRFDSLWAALPEEVTAEADRWATSFSKLI